MRKVILLSTVLTGLGFTGFAMGIDPNKVTDDGELTSERREHDE
jgi:hypothetical protein